MPPTIQNRFTQYELTPLEIQVASRFNDLQQKLIQNLIAEAALEKVSLTFNPANPLQFAQQEAELHGKMEILEYLLSQSQQYQSEGE